MNLAIVGSRSFNNYKYAKSKMINEYKRSFQDDNIYYDKDTKLVKYNDTLFGIIFKNHKYFFS